MSPEIWMAIIAGVTLLILWTVTILGGAAWFQSQLKTLKAEILGEFNLKHHENALTVRALENLVMRHDLLLDPEFSDARKKNGQASHG